jgi:signal transduction histidine kinase
MNQDGDRSAAELYQQSLTLRKYVGLDDSQIALAASVWEFLEPDIDSHVSDFYAQIIRHEAARRVISGPEQIKRLQQSLKAWIIDLFSSKHDEAFVARRRAVGLRHVQIGLDSIWVSAAMSRLRDRILQSLAARYSGHRFAEVSSAISRLVDLDLALIQDAYHAESVAKKIAAERDFAEGVIATAQAVVMMVTSDGVIVRSNQFLAKKLGWASFQAHDNERIQAVNCFDLVANSEREAFQEFISRVAKNEDLPPLETNFFAASGPQPRVRWHARKYQANETMPHSGGLPLVLCVGQDISELSDAQQRLIRSERLAAIGQTMTGLAHESRNAFQRSQAALETLSLELEDRPAAVKLVERIQRAHDHLLHLYEEVLQFARPVRLELQQLHLVTLINQTWDHIRQASSEKQMILELDTIPTIELYADPFALEQVFRNLLENAIEASGRESRIQIQFSNVWLGVDRCIEVKIRDFGIGMSDDAISRSFEPFYTTRARGTGLGLSISRRLAESHGGTLELQRETPGIVAVLKIPLRARPVEFTDASVGTDYRRSTPTPP